MISNTLNYYIFSKFVKLYANKVHSSKEFKLLFVCSEPSPACYMVLCVYNFIQNSLMKYNILVLCRFWVNFYGQSQFI